MTEWDPFAPQFRIRRSPPADFTRDGRDEVPQDQRGGSRAEGDVRSSGQGRQPTEENTPRRSSRSEGVYAGDSGSQAGQNDEDTMEEFSPRRIEEAMKELTQAKRDFTLLKNRNIANLQRVDKMTNEDIKLFQGLLDSAYKRLQTIVERARQATEDQEMLSKIDSGMAKYDQEYEDIRGRLDEERGERQEREDWGATPRGTSKNPTTGQLYPDLQDPDANVSNSARDLSTGDTPFRTVNQSVSQQLDKSRADRARTGRTDKVNQMTVRGSPEPRSLSSSPRAQQIVKTKKKKSRKKNVGRGTESDNLRQTAQTFMTVGTTNPTFQVDGLEVARMVQAATSAGWDSARIKTAIDYIYQRGNWPPELRNFQEDIGPRSSTAIGSPLETVFRPRTVNFDIPQTPAPDFVTGANARPLRQQGSGPPPAPAFRSTGFFTPRHRDSGSHSAFRPIVPRPQPKPWTRQGNIQSQAFSFGTGGAAAQSEVVPPHLQPTLPWPPEFSQPPPQPFVSVSGMQPSYHFSARPSQTWAGNQLSTVTHHSTGYSQGPQPSGSMFGNHSFSQDQRLRPGTFADQIHWGYDPQSRLEKPLMKINHVVFDGTLRSCSFEEFRATFAVVCGGRNMPESQKLVCLKQLLAGDPLKIFNNVVGYELAPGSLERVLRTLEDQFGGPQRIINTYINRLTQYPVIRRFDCGSLLDLLTVIEEIYNRYESHNPGFLQQDEVLVAHIRRIIPFEERQTYYSKLAEHRRRDTFLTLRDYLRSRYESFRLAAIADAGLSLKQSSHILEGNVLTTDQNDEDSEVLLASREAEAISKSRTGENSLAQRTENNIPTVSRKSPTCSFCSKDHYIWRCPEFTLADVKLRYTHVRDKRLCFHCLLPGHRIRDCKFRPDLVCGMEGCKKKHHRLVHNHTETGLCAIEIFVRQQDEEEMPEEDILVQDSLISLSLNSEDKPVVLPLEEENIAIKTVTLELRCGNTRRRVLAALDSCSNNTNIDADLAEELGLPVLRSNIPREMHFLERRAKITSDYVKFVVSPLGSDATFELAGFTIKNLMQNTPVIDWNQAAKAYPHLREADIPTPKSLDRVQILIGTEFAELMIPHRVLRGPNGSGAPVAELTDLGWAFSGRTNRKHRHQSSCQADCSFAHCCLMALGSPERNAQQGSGCMVGPGNVGLMTNIQENPTDAGLIDFDPFLAPHEGEHLDSTAVDVLVNLDSTDTSGSQTMSADMIDFNLGSELLLSLGWPTTETCLTESSVDNLETYLSILDRPNEEHESASNLKNLDQDLNELMQRHWELEAIGLLEKAPRISRVKDPSPREWSRTEIELDAKIKIVYLEEQGQFQMSIPWKMKTPDFENNRFAVNKRQESTLRHLGDRIEEVRKIFTSYLEKDYIRKLENWETQENNCRYLPFFCVVDETRDTTPVRIVWDCKAVYDGKSLNSEIELTPNRLQDLFKVLLRLRKYRFTVASDVSEMFLKIVMDPKDRKFHRFVFEGEDYEWNVILFGNVSSPNGSQKVLATACDLFGAKYPEAVETLRESCYMDDASDSRASEEQALLLTKQLIQLLGHCKMPVHKFYTNSVLIIRNIEPSLLAKQITLDEKNVSIDTGKILGMKYSVEEGDVLMFSGKFKSIHEWTNKSIQTKVEEGCWTKRLVSRAAASIYDPHGLIAPFTVCAKIILQEIWKRKELDWDDTLPPVLCRIWEGWLRQVFEVPKIHIPRWSKFEPRCQAQLHTFCDASENGMCCAVYLRVKKGPTIEVTLLAAKARVSPLRAESISRLELCACVLGTRLCAAVKDVYPVSAEDTFFWTDSEVCLHWINTPAKSFKAYVAHRVGEIQTYTEPRQWLHVPSSENPADIGTRPITAAELKCQQLWWGGPSFLKLPITGWPRSKVVRQIETKELKNTVFLNIAPLREVRFVDAFQKLHPRFFSVGKLYNGLLRCLFKWAYVLRAVRIFQGGKRPGQKALHSGELEAAKRLLIRQAQLSTFREEIGLLSRDPAPPREKSLGHFPEARKSRILQFTPFLDEFGILRSRSRLEKGMDIYDFDTIYPVILDRHSDFTRLLVEEAHFGHEHPIGHNALKAALAANYIILGLGTLCNQIKFRCAVCRANRGKVAAQLQAALPKRRLGEKMRPFTHVGMDFAGHFEVKVGRGKPRKKLYVLVLTCMAVRAVHLEPTGGMDTAHVLNAISRFVDIRGLPETITTDNQTSFQKADKDLADWYKAIDFEFLQEKTGTIFRSTTRGITWVFNPPLAPHFGGVFEIMVKAMKRALKATVTHADLTEEEFRTMISKVSWMLNNRPIQPVGDPSDFEALTPNHFLNGAPPEAIFPPDLPTSRIGLQDRLKYQIEVQQHFWQRFQTEIVPLLCPRRKWKEHSEDIKENDVVIEVGENTPRGEWRRMRVTRVIPSEDGLIRKVEVTNGFGKTYIRPISKIIPIVC